MENNSISTHQIVDLGPGPKDDRLGTPVQGDKEECVKYIDELNANYPNVRTDGKERFVIEEIGVDVVVCD